MKNKATHPFNGAPLNMHMGRKLTPEQCPSDIKSAWQAVLAFYAGTNDPYCFSLPIDADDISRVHQGKLLQLGFRGQILELRRALWLAPDL